MLQHVAEGFRGNRGGKFHDMSRHAAATHMTCLGILRRPRRHVATCATCHVGCRCVSRDAKACHVRCRDISSNTPRHAAQKLNNVYDRPIGGLGKTGPRDVTAFASAGPTLIYHALARRSQPMPSTHTFCFLSGTLLGLGAPWRKRGAEGSPLS